MKCFTLRSGDAELTLYPGKDIAVIVEAGTERTVEVTRWVFRDNLPPVPVIGFNGHTEAEVARAVLEARLCSGRS